ncbi:phage N-6-adenine-methyltransferase [Herbiconiux daphne]|uniref:Phage N-6-adenine-methyltransferase n=1 Tax=Herbiconiux daphne TaxID=2970914 RepID=A0ABT2H9E3_9MICO|nr:phage N-6-adenine-methyltransferase [Herbiconiux daphne]MCS5736552.1 phage N-6-adenine-methyltransferase [Herbiconiux daphne]
MRSDFGGSDTPVNIRDLWQTPFNIYQNLNDEFNFVGDVAASDINHLHMNYLTEEDDALTTDWNSVFGSGYKWCNPPYSDIGPWIDKAASERSLVMLIPADVSVGWFKKALATVDEVRLITGGRISFVRADTQEPQNGNNKGSMLLIWHPRRCEDSPRFTTVDRNELMDRAMVSVL